jgi:protein-S-isoprenylcysteine O-methyltransferase Ste14
VYACYLITDAGFLLANFHWINVVLICTVLIAQILRIRAEERVLTQSADYADYRTKVPYRLLPGLY